MRTALYGQAHDGDIQGVQEYLDGGGDIDRRDNVTNTCHQLKTEEMLLAAVVV